MIDAIFDGLYISGKHVLKRQDETYAEGVHAVVRLDGFHKNPLLKRQWDDRFALLHLPFPDGTLIPDGYLRQATAFIEKHRRAGEGVLVHCQMGISRSSAVILAYLIEYQSHSLAEAFKRLQDNHPVACPHPYLLVSLAQEYTLPYDTDAIFDGNFLDQLLSEG